MSDRSLKIKFRQRLEQLAAYDIEIGIQTNFNEDSARANTFSFDLDSLFIDFSKTHISKALLNIYLEIAEDVSLIDKRRAMFSGERINNTEDRSVLHPLLRDPNNQGISTVSPELIEQAHIAKQQLLEQCGQIESSLKTRTTPVTDIIHIGIGGSSLGTQLLYEAVALQASDIKIHFIGNIDAHKLVRIYAECDPVSTIVIGVSKTFTTTETLQNIRSIIAWYEENNVSDYLQYFYAVTANYTNAIDFGIQADNVVTFPEWVGGRYSVWSSVSLSTVLVLGLDKFEEFLAGAARMDQHFYNAELSQNICFIAAALDHYYANFIGSASRAIFAYDSRLESLVDYLQQLETESNGKDRQLNGDPVDQKTSQVVWGGVGTDVQHSVFQMLHQGTSIIPSEFIIVQRPDHDLEDHHVELLANAVAQTAALLAGQDLATVEKLHASEGLSELTQKAKVFSGERPSTTMLLDSLTPYSLGMLLAFYEHRTFCGGVITNINSYDQMGVELGKRLAKQVKPMLAKSYVAGEDEAESGSILDGSTRQLIDLLRK